MNVFSTRLMMAVLALCVFSGIAQAQPFSEGPKKCQECHEREYDVWIHTPHFESYKQVHKKDEAKKIVKAVGGKSMKREDTCVTCHYTQLQTSASAKPKVKAGPSCESCHGASSDWRAIHNDYGGPDLKAEDEAPAHKAKRLADAEAAGMIASRMVYRIAGSCMQCHGLANPNIDGDTLTKMLEAGHPVESGFEVVKYSQGSVRHRFVPPNVNDNSELDPEGTAKLFLGGQAASLVYASQVEGKSQQADFVAAQKQRIANARKALEAVQGMIPEAKALLASPTEANALKFEAALAGKSVLSAVQGLLPAKADYK